MNAFKVIVVGGGPVGLTAAHSLSRANLDFVVLESRSKIVLDAGSNLVLLPIGLRVLGQLGQLGLLPVIERVSSPMSRFKRIDHDGRNLGDTLWFTYFKVNHGAYPRVISRHDLMQTLHDGLSAEAQAKLLPNKQVVDVVTGPDGVKVTKVRDLMRTAALQSATPVEVNDAKPFLTSHRAMWVRFPTVAPVQPGDASETHGYDCTLQLFAGEDTSVIGIYERLDRTQAGMVNLEEGILKRWSWDRIVLAGDAAHKFTPSTGAGCNNGIVDVVALANEMYHASREVRGASGDATAFPDRDRLLAAFDDYQQVRFGTVKDGLAAASQATGSATWSDMTHRFVDCHVLSKPSLQKFFATWNARALARTPVFEYVEGEEHMVGKFPWAQPIREATARAEPATLPV
ncbi:hypothetical protein B0T26DRAFT_751732 [Lasiosphaeria miniovina]|uniref:FAD-binding domain-containing protein n=1 Tax=Lasiosphaeria miniovina TaxID=1954250 RepID=A0AA40AKZ9_9PEZI|nr:uncharacterized protein B0T26DRAFT_751732 [Lasiosphaeria miniovina]KAK0717705.1 hypothetical protein B0T26DRAFT_751732 [Lasiosphaeria miniovina]